MSHQWYYNKPGLLDDETIGPVDHNDFLERVRDGSIKPMWLVSSPTATSGAWHKLEEVPKLMEIREKALHQREVEASAQQEALRQQRAADQAIRQAEQAEAQQQADAAAEGRRRIREAEDRAHQERLQSQPPIEDTTSGLTIVATILVFLFSFAWVYSFVPESRTSTGTWSIAVLLCLVIIALERIRLAVERSRRK